MQNPSKKLSTRIVCNECIDKPIMLDKEFDIENVVMNDRRFMKIKWQDDYRCARAIMVGKARADKDSDYRKIKNYSFWNVSAAMYLHSISNVTEGECGKREVEMFQKALPDYQIVFLAWCCSQKPFKVIFAGPNADKRIFIYKHNGRFDAMMPWACL